jgi:hypothetical protein
VRHQGFHHEGHEGLESHPSDLPSFMSFMLFMVENSRLRAGSISATIWHFVPARRLGRPDRLPAASSDGIACR